MGQKAYSMESMINAVLMSGFLRDAKDAMLVLRCALQVCVPEPSVREYLLQLLSQTKTLMSAASMYRHRLTVHMGYCLMQQDDMAELLGSGAMVTWRTLDLSPKAGYEWMMHGRTCILQRDPPIAFGLSMRMCAGGPPEEQQELCRSCAN